MKTPIRSRASLKHWFGAALVMAAFLLHINVTAQGTDTHSLTNQPTKETPTMKNFVIIFRQGPHPLTDADKQHRAAETSAWASRQNSAGHKLDPHILAPESVHRGLESPDNKTIAWPITALLF